MRPASVIIPIALSILAPVAQAGPIAYAICQAGCSLAAVTCYSAAGFTYGTVAAAAAPAAIVACNSALGSCSAACAGTVLIAPVP